MSKSKEGRKTIETPPPAPDPAPGIPCPRCGCCHASSVENTRHLMGFTRRYRTCRHCGKRFSTSERPA